MFTAGVLDPPGFQGLVINSDDLSFVVCTK